MTAADRFALGPGDSMTVSYQVLVDDPLDSNVVQVINTAGALSASLPVAVTATTVDPVAATGAIGDRVWLDGDGDGFQDVGEPGLAGVLVELIDVATSSVVATLMTDSQGRYLFDYLSPGDYQVRVDESTVPGTAGSLVASAGVANPSAVLTITGGESFVDVDFGYKPASGTGVVGDRIWSDADGDGVQDPGEPGLGGVTVQIRNASGGVVASAVTSADGSYIFPNLSPGEYVVDVTDTSSVLTGYSATTGPQSVGGTSSTPFTLVADEALADVDFGFQDANLGVVENRIWRDLDADEQQGESEPGIAGVTVSLLDSLGNVVATTTTDESGDFSFAGVEEGSYTVAVTDVEDRLDGFAGTTPFAQVNQWSVTVPAGPGTVSGVDFGYNIPGLLGDEIFLDADGNGVRDPGEAGVSGVTVDLFDVDTGLLVTSATTGVDGRYEFDNLQPGVYRVDVTDTANVLGSRPRRPIRTRTSMSRELPR